MSQVDRRIQASRPPEVIRDCADNGEYDDVKVRTHILTLAHKRTRDCLRKDICDPSAV